MKEKHKHIARLNATLAALLLLLCAAPASARRQAAGSIGGRVLDPQGAALTNARVTIYRRDAATPRLTAATDAAGTYRFENLAPGNYLLDAESPGFITLAQQEASVREGAPDVTLDFKLSLTGIGICINVTANDTPQTVDEASKSVSTVSAREMEERDEFSIADALRNLPGLRVQQLGGPASFTSIKTRGLRNQDTALLFDGLRFRDPTAPEGDATSFLSDLFSTDAGRVEVLRGSGSSLYGTNAIGGVVNVISDEGGGPFHGSLLAEGGGLGFFRGRAQVAGSAADSRLYYSAAVSHLNVTRGVDGDDAARNTSGQGRVSVRLGSNATLWGRVYAGDTFAQLNEEPQAVGTIPATGVVDARPLARAELRHFERGTPLSELNVGDATLLPGANDPDSARAGRFFSGSLTFNQDISELLSYALTYHGLATRRSLREGPASSGGPFDFFEPAGPTRNNFDGHVHTLRARTDWRIGRAQTVTAGYEFESESFRNRTLAANPSDNSSVEVTERSQAFFIQDQVRLLEGRLQMSAAFRAQTFSLGAPRFDPSAGAPFDGLRFDAPSTAYTGDGSIAYLFRSTGTKLRAHIGNGYRKPSLFERFGTFFSSFTGSFSPLGDPRLAPERSLAFDAGVDQTLGAGRARLSATYFYTRLQEVVGFANERPADDPFGRIFGGYINTGGGLARGLELSAGLMPLRTLELFASYTHTNSDQRRPQIAGIVRSLGIPDHQFSLVATQRFGNRVVVNFDFTASSDYLAPVFDSRTFVSRAYRFPGIRKGDLTASYTLPLADSRQLRFFGKVENVFDRDYFENGFRTPGVNARGGAAFSF